MNNKRIMTFGMVTLFSSVLMMANTAGARPAGALGKIERGSLSDTTQVHGLGDVVVTGSNQATSRNLLPYTVSIVNNRQLEATGKTQLLAALSGEVPSLFVSQRNIFGFGVSNGGSGGIKIRGVGGSPTNSILMMVDGQPQFAGLYSHPVADFYETEYVDHVEVLRGPGSVLYGSNAMGGVINVITKRALQDGVQTVLTSQYGSYNTWQNSLTNMVRKGKFSSMVSVGYDRTDGLKDHFDFKQSSLYAKMGYDFTPHWNLSADYSLMNFIGNDPIYAKVRANNPEATDIYHQNITRGEASLTLSNHYGNAAAYSASGLSSSSNTNGAVRIYYSYGNHFIDDPNHFHSLDDRFGILAYQNFNPWKMATATVGFDFNTYTGKIPMSGGHVYGDGSMPAKMQTIDRKSITEYSPYVTLQQALFDGVLTLNGGVRMANSDKFGTHWLPQVGFSVHPGDEWTLKASLAKGYRNPSFREMYLYGTANPDLDPESMMNYELTLGKHFSRYFSIDVTGYFSEGSNMIQTASVPTGNAGTSGGGAQGNAGGSTMRNMNTGSFINKGIEISAQSNPLDVLSLRASYSFMHTSLSNLTAAPKNQYFLGIGWQALKQLTVDAELKGIGGLYVADDVKHQNYALLGLRLTYKPVKFLDIFAHFDNLTDAKYEINKGYEMPGFTVMGGVKVRF